MEKPFLRALRGQTQSTAPVWFMRQAGRYLPQYRAVRSSVGSFLDLCYSPRLAAQVTLQPIERFGFDAAILFADILLIPDKLGQPLSFTEGEGPRLEPVTDQAGVNRLRESYAAGRTIEHLAPVFETVERVRTQLDDATALIGFCGAPWTVATYMVQGKSSQDQAVARDLAARGEPWFADLIALLGDVSVDYLSAQISAGAETVQIFDTWAGVLNETDFFDYVIVPTRTIVEKLRARHRDVPIIGFPRGAGANYVNYCNETGVDAVGTDHTVSLDWMKASLQRKLPVQGNLDPVVLRGGGERLEREVRRIVSILNDGPFVFNLGHGILPDTPVEHVARALDIVRSRQVMGS